MVLRARRRRGAERLRRGAGRDRREASLAEVSRVLNERLAGLTLREIRATLGDAAARHRGARGCERAAQHLLQEGEQIFDAPRPLATPPVLLGQASVLAEQPEFASGGESATSCSRSPTSREALASCCVRHNELARASRSRSATSTSTRASRLHGGHGRVSFGSLSRRDRRDRPHAHAVREGHRARARTRRD